MLTKLGSPKWNCPRLPRCAVTLFKSVTHIVDWLSYFVMIPRAGCSELSWDSIRVYHSHLNLSNMFGRSFTLPCSTIPLWTKKFSVRVAISCSVSGLIGATLLSNNHTKNSGIPCEHEWCRSVRRYRLPVPLNWHFNFSMWNCNLLSVRGKWEMSW